MFADTSLELLTPDGFERFLDDREALENEDACAQSLLTEMGFPEAETGHAMLSDFLISLHRMTPAEKARMGQMYPAHILAVGQFETEEDRSEVYRLLSNDFPDLFQTFQMQIAAHYSDWLAFGRRHGAQGLPAVH